ncbi:hypothetical protein D3H49_01115 [Bifidobacterium breve]|nr:hypothetical protein D3H49_01115 [Bifidobacterium breve]
MAAVGLLPQLILLCCASGFSLQTQAFPLCRLTRTTTGHKSAPVLAIGSIIHSCSHHRTASSTIATHLTTSMNRPSVRNLRKKRLRPKILSLSQSQ